MGHVVWSSYKICSFLFYKSKTKELFKQVTLYYTYSTFFIQKIQDSKFGLDEIYTGLVIVKVYEFPLYVFL